MRVQKSNPINALIQKGPEIRNTFMAPSHHYGSHRPALIQSWPFSCQEHGVIRGTQQDLPSWCGNQNRFLSAHKTLTPLYKRRPVTDAKEVGVGNPAGRNVLSPDYSLYPSPSPLRQLFNCHSFTLFCHRSAWPFFPQEPSAFWVDCAGLNPCGKRWRNWRKRSSLILAFRTNWAKRR